jgi:quercetin dioxygenase-like cupin family protein
LTNLPRTPDATRATSTVMRPTISDPNTQRTVRFLGGLVRILASAEHTGSAFALLEHTGPRGYSAPLHSHTHDEETFFVLDGQLRVHVGELDQRIGPGAVAILPRQLPHGFTVISDHARFLTLHTPTGYFDAFLSATAMPTTAQAGFVPPAPGHTDHSLDPAALATAAARYGIHILRDLPAPEDIP